MLCFDPPKVGDMRFKHTRRAAMAALVTVVLSVGGFGWTQAESASRVTAGNELRAAVISSNPVLVTRSPDGQLGGVSIELARVRPSPGERCF
jgi:polar amino acid transport system substrate-binding protein